MYSGLDKAGGGLVGSAESQQISVDFGEISETTSAEEILICEEVTEDHQIQKIYAVAKLDPNDGALCWQKSYDEQFILSKTIGMSQMTSMLHDVDRNTVYEHAIARVISHFQQKYQRNPTVLDIGAGTGLLSMLCVRYGAEFVIGCEMFEAMAEVARGVIEQNGYADKIMIVTAKSCDIDSLPFAPDIIISELLDSALLGEGVICSHKDAIDRFLEKSLPEDNIAERIIPHSATIYGTLIQSLELCHLSTVSNALCLEGLTSVRKTHWSEVESDTFCPWSKMIPVHWNERFEESALKLSESFPLIGAEFYHGANDEVPNTSKTSLTVLRSGTVHGLLCWWDLNLVPISLLDVSDPNTFSYKTSPGAQRWQDHWQQVVIPFPGGGIQCEEGDILIVTTFHDDIHVWCQVDCVQRGSTVLYPPNWVEHADPNENLAKKPKLELPHSPPECTCGWHILCNPDRISSLNDTDIMLKWKTGIRDLLERLSQLQRSDDHMSAIICDVSDGSTLALMTASQLANLDQLNRRIQVFSIERKQFSFIFYSQLLESNEDRIGSLMTVWSEDCWKEALNHEDSQTLLADASRDYFDESLETVPRIICLISECFFYQMSTQPVMSALSHFYSVCDVAQRNLRSSTPARLLVAPLRAKVMTAGFELIDLRVSHGDAGVVSGFDHSSLDHVQQHWHQFWFPYKLGNYRKKILTAPCCIATIDYDHVAQVADGSAGIACSSGQIPITSPGGRLDCMVIWVEYEISETVSTEYWTDDFPPYLTTSTKFFPVSSQVSEGRHSINFETEFHFGDSDIETQYSLVEI